MSSTPIAYPTAEMLRAALAQLPAGWLGELGERLRGDVDGSVYEQYCRAFEATIEKSKLRMARPLPEADFEATTATINACTQAGAVLDLVQEALHPRGGLRSGS
jgi:hypothetical protein